MRHILTTFLTLAVLMAGMPSNWCGCGCRALAGEFDAAAFEPATETAGACSHCADGNRADDNQQSSSERSPCRCADCSDQWQAVAEAKIIIALVQRTATTGDQVNDIALSWHSELSSPHVSCSAATARFGSSGFFGSGGSSCAIPILLGHLLL